MTDHALALANLLTFLLEHHAESIGSVSYSASIPIVILTEPPKGKTMLGWEWTQASMRGMLSHRTPSGIVVLAPENSR